MSTDTDLCAACRELAEDAPDLAPMLATLPSVASPRLPRRHVLASAGAALAVSALAVGLVVVLPGDRTPQPTGSAVSVAATWAHPCASAGRPELTDVTIGSVPGLAATSQTTTSCSGYASRELETDAGFDVADVKVFRHGVFDTDLLAHARRVSGSGIDAYAVTLTGAQLQPGLPGGDGCTQQAGTDGASSRVVPCRDIMSEVLAWKYAPGSWAVLVVERSPQSRAFFGERSVVRQLQIAAAVDTAHPTPVRVPVGFDRLPDRVRALGVSVYRTRHGVLQQALVSLGLTGQRGCAADTACEQFGEVALGTRSRTPRLTGTPVPVDGRSAYLTDQGQQRPDITLQLWTGTWLVSVGEASDRAVPDRALIDIAKAARYAKSTSPTTWFTADDALPA